MTKKTFAVLHFNSIYWNLIVSLAAPETLTKGPDTDDGRALMFVECRGISATPYGFLRLELAGAKSTHDTAIALPVQLLAAALETDQGIPTGFAPTPSAH